MSKSDFFYKSTTQLQNIKLQVIDYCMIKGFNNKQIDLFLEAYDYYCANPHRYDGATMSQDLYDVDRLELAALVHDYVYQVLGANLSVKAMIIADKIMKAIMEQTNKSGFEISRRMVLLWIVNQPFAFYNRVKTGKRITNNQFERLKEIYNIFVK